MGKDLKDKKTRAEYLHTREEKEKALRAHACEWGCALNPNPNTGKEQKKHIKKLKKKQRIHRGGQGKTETWSEAEQTTEQDDLKQYEIKPFCFICFSVHNNTGLDACLHRSPTAATQAARQVREQKRMAPGLPPREGM